MNTHHAEATRHLPPYRTLTDGNGPPPYARVVELTSGPDLGEPGLADFVRARDVYCRQPGCRRRAAGADLDHTVAWEDGGTTSERNLGARCRHDHRLKTFARGWTVKQHPDGRMAVTTPTGHTYVSHPYDYRLDPAPRPPPSDSPDLGPPPL